jgi:hypothetical protein
MKLYFFGEEGEVFNWPSYINWDLFISAKDNKPKTNDSGYMIVWNPYFSIGDKVLTKYEASVCTKIDDKMPERLCKLLIKNLFKYIEENY